LYYFIYIFTLVHHTKNILVYRGDQKYFPRFENFNILMQKVSSNKNNSNCKMNFSKIILLVFFIIMFLFILLFIMLHKNTSIKQEGS